MMRTMTTKEERIKDLYTAIKLGYDALEMAINDDDWGMANYFAKLIARNRAELDALEND